MSDFITACIQANREVAARLVSAFEPLLVEKRERGAGGDISSEADLVAESIFVDYLRSFGTIESEESGVIGNGKPSIIIDPLDGSANFSSRFPYFGTSVAMLDEQGMLQYAVVCNLTNGDLFFKKANASVKLGNLYHDRVTALQPVERPEIGIFEKAHAYPELVADFLEAGYKFRSPGATALSLAYAYSASYFLFMGSARLYDIVAGLALCEGLAVIVEEDYVIVSSSETIANNIESIIRRRIS